MTPVNTQSYPEILQSWLGRGQATGVCVPPTTPITVCEQTLVHTASTLYPKDTYPDSFLHSLIIKTIKKKEVL